MVENDRNGNRAVHQPFLNLLRADDVMNGGL
jgi:hypothetical protein